MNKESSLLPYRSSGEDLVKLIEALARGRSFEQVQSFFSRKNFEGTATAAGLLGFVDAESGALTEKGEELALADAERRREIIKQALFSYEPYLLFLEAIFSGDNPSVTTLDRVEKWWNINGFGNSQSNRSEAASTLSQLLDYSGLGNYIRGRRGHQTRIEWKDSAKEEINAYLRRKLGTRDQAALEGKPASSEHLGTDPGITKTLIGRAYTSLLDGEAANRVSLELEGGRMVEITVPATLSQREKDRLLAILDLLLVVEEQGSTEERADEGERDTAEAAPEE